MTLWPWAGPFPRDDARVRAALLPLTLERAAALPYYRRRWGSRWRRGLAALPLLTKPEAVEHQRGLLAPGLAQFVGAISSGTLHGDRRPLRVPETDGERQAFAELAQARASGRRATRGRAGLTLEVLSMQHGFPLGPAPEGTLRVPWSFTESTLRLLGELLERGAGGRTVDALVIGAGALPPLTAWLYEQGADFRAFRVRDIGTTGFRLGPHWKARVEALWGATVWDNFSLSELATPAVQCGACGRHHWLWPAHLTEVLHPRTGRAVSRGVGQLVVTTLYPFVQAMPLVRYATGDLVEPGPFCPVAKERGFTMRGRLGQCVLGPEGALVASPLDVEAFLDALPDVERLPHPDVALGLVKSVDVGVPRFELAGDTRRGRARVQVRFEVRFDPRVFAARAAALERGLVRHLRRSAPAARRADLEVRAVRRGTLTRRWTKF